MKTLIIENKNKIKKVVSRIEKSVGVKIFFKVGSVEIEGDAEAEFIAEKVVRACDMGFDVDDALVLKNDDFVFEIVGIKKHTHRKNLEEVRGRVIGTSGKARKTVQALTGSKIVIHGNEVGLIVDSDHLDAAVQGLCSLIQGAKHANVFSYLEKQNKKLRKLNDGDLGLKNPEKDLE